MIYVHVYYMNYRYIYMNYLWIVVHVKIAKDETENDRELFFASWNQFYILLLYPAIH